MGAWSRALVFVAAVGFGACTGSTAYICESDSECVDGSVQGRCEVNGWCSFPADDCDSGQRYSEHAGGELAGQCVEGATADTTGAPATDGPASPPSDSSDEGSTTLALDDGPATSSTTAGLDSFGDSSEEGTTAASEDTGIPKDPAVFSDDFNRPDDPAIGNGWVEKHPTAFQLLDGRVIFESDADGYEDNLWYRDESLLDVEVCISFQILESDNDNHPQVHARIQPEDIEVPGSVTSYILYIDGETLRLRRDIEGSSDQQWPEMLLDPLFPGQSYRMCLTVTGTTPVQLEGRLWVDEGGWRLDTEILVDDNSMARIDTPGATGSSGADAAEVANLVYDDFQRTDLGL